MTDYCHGIMNLKQKHLYCRKANAAVSKAALTQMAQVAVHSGVLFYDISTQTKR